MTLSGEGLIKNMKKRFYIVPILLLFLLLIFQIDWPYLFGAQTLLSDAKDNSKLEKLDSNKDGSIDTWLYRDDSNIPLKWIRDSNHNGQPDKWSFFKNGKAFIDEEDLDFDGKADLIIIQIVDSQGKKLRMFSLVLKDKEKNVFIPQEDTGWIEKDQLKFEN